MSPKFVTTESVYKEPASVCIGDLGSLGGSINPVGSFLNYFPLYDANGTIHALADANTGEIKERYWYSTMKVEPIFATGQWNTAYSESFSRSEWRESALS